MYFYLLTINWLIIYCIVVVIIIIIIYNKLYNGTVCFLFWFLVIIIYLWNK